MKSLMESVLLVAAGIVTATIMGLAGAGSEPPAELATPSRPGPAYLPILSWRTQADAEPQPAAPGCRCETCDCGQACWCEAAGECQCVGCERKPTPPKPKPPERVVQPKPKPQAWIVTLTDGRRVRVQGEPRPGSVVGVGTERWLYVERQGSRAVWRRTDAPSLPPDRTQTIPGGTSRPRVPRAPSVAYVVPATRSGYLRHNAYDHGFSMQRMQGCSMQELRDLHGWAHSGRPLPAAVQWYRGGGRTAAPRQHWQPAARALTAFRSLSDCAGGT